MRKVMVAGVGMTSFGIYLDRSTRSLADEAIAEAIKDAGAEVKDIGAVYFGNAVGGLITGQESIRGQVAVRNTGLLDKGIPVYNIENACASGSTAVNLAWLAVASGQHEAVLAVGAEKMSHKNKAVTFGALESAVDQESLDKIKAEIGSNGAGQTQSMFMDIYSAMTRKYMEKSGATAEDFAQIAVKSHQAGALNPKAQFRNEVTIEQVMQSRVISDPIRLLMCSPVGDGAAVILICSEDYAKKISADAVTLAASVVVSGSADGSLEPATIRAVSQAYNQAGVGPEDVDVVEVHDAAAPAEIIEYEELGLCAEGEGPAFLASGATLIGGKVPVNPSGGLISKGHPIGATGCAQIVELVDQLRGRCGPRQKEGARVALAENGGGFLGPDPAATTITILTK